MTKNEAAEFFKLDRYASEGLGAVIEEVSDGHSVVSMTICDRHRAAHGGVMGGAVFSLAERSASFNSPRRFCNISVNTGGKEASVPLPKRNSASV